MEKDMRNNIIWITGAKGNLGQALVEKLKKPGNTVLVTDVDLDVTDLEEVRNYAVMNGVEYIINCASITSIKECEKDMVQAYKVNAMGARNLSIASRQVNAVMIQLSTDDVFSGIKGGPLTEFDTPDPVSVYGKSKLAGEKFVESLNPKHIIIRSSWVYGHKVNDFITKTLEKAERGEEIAMPTDYYSAPTNADELAKLIEILIDADEYGIFHASSEGSCSRYEYARTVLDLAGKKDYPIRETDSSDEGSHTRPMNIRLENLMLKMTGLFTMPDWRESLTNFMTTENNTKNKSGN
jgi:dTDP-4-dehydrorhamnose reductase